MATYFLWSGAGGAGTGADWTNAFTTLTAALAVATADGDVIKVHKTHADSISSDTTWTFQNNLRIVCVDKDNSDALAEMGTGGQFGNTSTSYSINLAGTYNCYFYGLRFLVSAIGNDFIRIGTTDGYNYVFERCIFQLNGYTSGTQIFVGISSSSNYNQSCQFFKCDFNFGHASQSISCVSKAEYIGCTIGGTAPSILLKTASDPSNTNPVFNGCDLSAVTGTLVGDCTNYSLEAIFTNCKLGSGVTPLASQTVANSGGGSCWLFNCSSGDQHYHFEHHNALGSTVMETGIYANDGALYDGTNHVTWKIVTSPNASFYAPYISPWMEQYHDGTSAITPILEIVRSGSATAYQNDEIWGEWTYQATSGSTRSSFVDDRKEPLASPADQTTGDLGAGDWTGENATSWFGKLAPASAITPAEIGMLRARVCVGEPSITVYIDPTIRT